jgi:hypothetical protein
MAARATTDNLKEAFIVNINALCDNFKCKKCQQHFRKFIEKYDLKDYWNIYDSKGRDYGFFKWAWELHNHANGSLGKYKPSLEESYNYYTQSDAGVCTTCGGGGGKSYTDDASSRSKSTRVHASNNGPKTTNRSVVMNSNKSSTTSGFPLISTNKGPIITYVGNQSSRPISHIYKQGYMHPSSPGQPFKLISRY